MTVEPPTSDTLNQPALTLQRSASLLKHRAASADGWPQDVVCRWQGFLTVTFLSPHCHSLILSILLTDELPPRRHLLSQCSTNQPSQPAANISGLLREREREIAAARSGCHFLPRFRWGDKEMSDMGRQLEHTKALALTSLVTFKALAKDGTEEKQFYSKFFGNTSTSNKHNVTSKFDSCKKTNKGLVFCLGVERNNG